MHRTKSSYIERCQSSLIFVVYQLDNCLFFLLLYWYWGFICLFLLDMLDCVLTLLCLSVPFMKLILSCPVMIVIVFILLWLQYSFKYLLQHWLGSYKLLKYKPVLKYLYFSRIFTRQLSCTQQSWCTVICFQGLKYIILYFIGFRVTDKRSDVILTCFLLSVS